MAESDTASMNLDYHGFEDRVLLHLPQAGPVQRFWLTRRQCLALILACRGAGGEAPPLQVSPAPSPETQALAPSEATVSSAAGVSAPAHRIGKPEACHPKLQITRKAQALHLALLPAEGERYGPIRLTLGPREQLGLVKTLRHLAARARWDIDAAESRAAANAVMHKAQRLH